MDFKPKLEQRTELKQILTPKLIQSLQLLVLPRLEFVQRLQQELMENPVLELVQNQDEDESVEVEKSLQQWRKLLDGFQMTSMQLEDRESDADTFDPISVAKYEKTLYDDLTEQLSASAPDERTYKIGEFIIGNLNERGFLLIPLEDIAKEIIRLGEIVPPPSVEEIEKVLKIVQSLSPAGIASRDLRECLLIQLEDMNLKDSLAYKIVHDHYEDLKSKNAPQLAQILAVSEKELEDALEILSRLSFYPAEGRETNAVSIEPDLAVFLDENGKWQVIYNHSDIPIIRVNKHYQALLREAETLSQDAKKFLREHLDRANWWVEIREQRQKTLVNIMYAIIERQPEFFSSGPENLRPLKTEDIAPIVGVHPTTVSRAIRDKYVLTPYGIFPMKYFFVRGLSSSAGTNVSTESVRQRITEIIDREDKKNPLSDEAIAEILRKEGIDIARRTVAKYREILGILPARRRKM